MHMSIWQAILIGLVYYLGFNGTPWLTVLGTNGVLLRPLISGTVVGIILGHPIEGAIIGAAINLPFLGFISAGGTLPMDPGIAGTLGTALAISTGVSAQVAISIAIPLSLLGTILWVAHMSIDVIFVHWIDKYVEKGDLRKACLIHVIPPQIICLLITAIPVALGAYFGPDFVKPIINALNGKPLHCLTIIGGILPALGIAMNMQAIAKKGSFAFYILGFMLAVYFKLDIIPIAILATVVAYIYTVLISTKENQVVM